MRDDFRRPVSADCRRGSRAASEEPRNLADPYLGTEHLLLGLRDGPAHDPAVRMLSASCVTRDGVLAVRSVT